MASFFNKHNFWIALLPILFLPNEVLPLQKSVFGQIQLMDVVLLLTSPFWFFTFLKYKYVSKLKNIRVVIYALLICVFISIILIQIRFVYLDNYAFQFSLFKGLKFSMYILFGLFIMDRFQRFDVKVYNKAILYIILILSVVIFWNFTTGNLGLTNLELKTEDSDFISYSAQNVISVALAILGASRIPILLNTPSLKGIGILLLLFSILLISGGRGGVVAFLVTLIYYVMRSLDIGRKIFYSMAGVAILGLLYSVSPEVKKQIDRTINPDTEYLRRYNLGVGGLDDGKRLNGILKSFPDWFDKPMLGYGFFHRGGQSALKPWGSHNMYLQILLELGLIGFTLMILFFISISQGVKKLKIPYPIINLSVRLAMLTAFFGGLSGEYFYACEALMAFMIAIAPLGLREIEKEWTIN